MERDEMLEKLFFELASESRLGILDELQVKALRMNEVARKLNLTATETCRQIQRLSEAKLIQKFPEGTYGITEYGKLILHLLPPLGFIFQNKDYFLNHNVWRLPNQFVTRIGELSGATLCIDTIENINRASHIVSEAEKYVWALGDKALESINPAMAQLVPKGVKFRFMFHESLLPIYKPVPEEAAIVEKRTLTEIPGVILCTEKEGGVCFPLLDGRMDYAGFFGKDPIFVNWTKELFQHYWDAGKRCFSS